ncbi:hypothetical protein B484DRAFT_457451 [Ochromonadaceae sp. CCMP2298]|nr:hypothetical protein B484DRAFT_457451 [Ochromonadaceae sp. CCMP2298]|mmetsp:Transcript_18035/g.40006  ORF Transcript_18035/g.40006 Transcript_18035/m.40006 type:complete len:384 (-) Transcript_18035:151-1302(-)
MPGLLSCCRSGARIGIYEQNLISKHTVSLHDHQMGTVIPIAVIGYALLQIAMGLQWVYSATPICHVKDENMSWAKYAMCTSAGCMVLSCTMKAINITGLMMVPFKRWNAPLIRTHITLFVMCFVSGTSQFLTFFWYYGGICQDHFGVYSPGAQWAEWLVQVPYMCYIALALEQKPQLDNFDIVIIALMGTSILFGFLMNLNIPLGLAVFFLLGSCCCLVTVTVMIVQNYNKVNEKTYIYTPKKIQFVDYFPAKQKKAKSRLLMHLLVIMWYYPIVWLLGATKALDLNGSYAAYLFGSVFGKVIFSTLVVESHTQLLFEFLLFAASKTNLSEMTHKRQGVQDDNSEMMSIGNTGVTSTTDVEADRGVYVGDEQADGSGGITHTS